MNINQQLELLLGHARDNRIGDFDRLAGEIKTHVQNNTKSMTPEVYRIALQHLLDIGLYCPQGRHLVREQLISTITKAYESEVSKIYHFPVMPLDNKVGLRADVSQIMEASAEFFEPGEAVIPSRGDGNCFMRACIQSLLIRGATTGKKDQVVALLRNIYAKHQQELRETAECNLKLNDRSFNFFIAQYLNDELTVDVLVRTYFPHYITDANGSIQILNPADEYDKYCYFLAACLRYDMSDFAKAIKQTADGTPYADLAGQEDEDFSAYDFMRTAQGSDMRKLQEDSDVQLALMYWPEQKVQLVTSQLLKERDARGVDTPTCWKINGLYSTESGDGFIRIDINQGSNHYDARVKPSIDGIAQRLALDDQHRADEDDDLFNVDKKHDDAVAALNNALDEYLDNRKEGRNPPREKYFWGGLFGGGIPYTQKLQAVNALKAALAFDPSHGDVPPQLRDHEKALRDGNLGRILRTFIRVSYWNRQVTDEAQSITGNRVIENPRVRDFITALDEHNQSLYDNKDQVNYEQGFGGGKPVI